MSCVILPRIFSHADDRKVLGYTISCVKIMSEKKTKVYCTYQDAPEHYYKGHPESPKRLLSLRGWLQESPYPEIEWLDFSPASEADLLLIHHKELLEELKLECRHGAHEFEPAPTYVTKGSYQAALGAVGATLKLSRKIIRDGQGFGFAIVRPPGHHAEPGQAMGFCLLNNVAIAAADAVASGIGKAAIIDFDAHHGNGIQAAFLQTPQIGYFSTQEKDSYPGTGRLESSQQGRGRIINIPLPAFSGNDVFFRVFDEILDPWIARFEPEILFVSAGYDGHFSDPLTTLTLDTNGYYQITQCLVDLAETYCEGRMIFVLEGGYDPVALKDNIQASLAALTGNLQYEDHYGEAPNVSPSIDTLIEDIKKIHQLLEK
ncbi:MAG TPA: histone deacetylase [Anaerolineaceae bacterium]|nr:histone deacetylase [Anaerolineaceae bacterium]